jgi:hypothetical protein
MNSKQTISENIVNIQVFSDNKTLCSKNEQGTEDMDAIFNIKPYDFRDYIKELVYTKSKHTSVGYFLDFDDLNWFEKETIIEHILKEDNIDVYSRFYAYHFIESHEIAKDYITSIFLEFQPQAQELLDQVCAELFYSYVHENGGRFYYDSETGERCVNF